MAKVYFEKTECMKQAGNDTCSWTFLEKMHENSLNDREQ